MLQNESNRFRAALAGLSALFVLAAIGIGCRGPSIAETIAPTSIPGGATTRAPLAASTETPVALPGVEGATTTPPVNGPAASDAPGSATSVPSTETSGTRQAGAVPITVRVRVVTGGQSPSVEVDVPDGQAATSTAEAPAGAAEGGAETSVKRTVQAGETVVEVVVELGLGAAGGGTVFGGAGSSLPGAAPPRPRETPFPPVAVGAGPGNARTGQTLFASKGCSGCHSTGTNTIVGPGLAGVADRAGAEAYLWESIRNPAVFVVPGFANDMPPFSSLTDQEVNDLIEYLKSLK